MQGPLGPFNPQRVYEGPRLAPRRSTSKQEHRRAWAPAGRAPCRSGNGGDQISPHFPASLLFFPPFHPSSTGAVAEAHKDALPKDDVFIGQARAAAPRRVATTSWAAESPAAAHGSSTDAPWFATARVLEGAPRRCSGAQTSHGCQARPIETRAKGGKEKCARRPLPVSRCVVGRMVISRRTSHCHMLSLHLVHLAVHSHTPREQWHAISPLHYHLMPAASFATTNVRTEPK